MNLHEITTQGTGVSLGPVTVTKAFSKFAGATCVLVLVQDPTVAAPVAVKVWGPASNTVFQEGMVVTFQGSGPKGKLEYKQYKDKWEINANDCNVLMGSGGAAPQAAPQAVPQSAPAAQSHQSVQGASAGALATLSAEERERRIQSICAIAQRFGEVMVDNYVMRGFTKDQACTLAAGAHNLLPTSWFLEKGFL